MCGLKVSDSFFPTLKGLSEKRERALSLPKGIFQVPNTWPVTKTNPSKKDSSLFCENQAKSICSIHNLLSIRQI